MTLANIHLEATWPIGMRSTLRALLSARLEPIDQLRDIEPASNFPYWRAQCETITA